MTIRSPVVLILRTVAIWRGDKRIAIFLSALLAGATITAAYFVNSFLRNLTGTHLGQVGNPLTKASLVFLNPVTKPPECALWIAVNHLFICYAVLLGFETGEPELPSISGIHRRRVL
jgi:hypothetical protein